MTTVVNVVLAGLFALLLGAMLARGERTLPLRLAAYRRLRFIPTPLCLWLAVVSLAVAISVMSCTKMWLIDGTVQQWAVNGSLLVWLVSLNVPACRWLTVKDRPTEKSEPEAGKPAFQVTFERLTATVVALHIRRTDGRCAILRQKLPEGQSNVHLVLRTIRRLHARLWACGVRSIRVTSPDITEELLKDAGRHERLLRQVPYVALPPTSVCWTKRVIIAWMRAEEPVPATERWWRYAGKKVLAAFTARGWRAAWRRLAYSWEAAAAPMEERGVLVTLTDPSEDRSRPMRCERKGPSTPDP